MASPDERAPGGAQALAPAPSLRAGVFEPSRRLRARAPPGPSTPAPRVRPSAL